MPATSVDANDWNDSRLQSLREIANLIMPVSGVHPDTEQDPCFGFEEQEAGLQWDISDACYFGSESVVVAAELKGSIDLVLPETGQSLTTSATPEGVAEFATWLCGWNDLYEQVFDLDAEESSAALARERSFRVLFPASLQDIRSRLGC